MTPMIAAIAARIDTASAPSYRSTLTALCARNAKAPSNAMSRTSVSASSEANDPIASMLASISPSLSGCRATRRATGQSGVATADAISHNAIAVKASAPGSRSGSRRHAT